jgi:hypothetical protein
MTKLLFLCPSASTSACFTQILKDLDDAIALLPNPSGNARIDKGAAMAFKGRVALFQASPQFNRTNNAQLWQAAYDANKAAVTYLRRTGKRPTRGIQQTLGNRNEQRGNHGKAIFLSRSYQWLFSSLCDAPEVY